MNIIIGLGGIGCISRMSELRERNIGLMGSIAEEREKYVRAITKKLFDAIEFTCELHHALISLEDDETKMRRIEREFFADIQKLYGYHACMEKIRHQLQNSEAGNTRILNKIILTPSVEWNELCVQDTSLEYPMTAKNESRFRLIRKKPSCFKRKVRLKPPLRCILDLLLQTLERTLKISEEKMQKQWEKWQYPQNRVRNIWTEIYRKSRQQLERYKNNKIHPEALSRFQYKRFCFINT